MLKLFIALHNHIYHYLPQHTLTVTSSHSLFNFILFPTLNEDINMW